MDIQNNMCYAYDKNDFCSAFFMNNVEPIQLIKLCLLLLIHCIRAGDIYPNL